MSILSNKKVNLKTKLELNEIIEWIEIGFKPFDLPFTGIFKLTMVNRIRYSSALDMRQSHSITRIPAITSKINVRMCDLEISLISHCCYFMPSEFENAYLLCVSFSRFVAQN